MIGPPPACLKCKHFRPDSSPPACAAFPGRIPMKIWQFADPHTAPIDGDHGVRFEPRSTPLPPLGRDR